MLLVLYYNWDVVFVYACQFISVNDVDIVVYTSFYHL